MGLYQSLYFMSLVGGFAGLLSWLTVLAIESILHTSAAGWIPDLVAAVMLGGLIGGMTVGFSDHWDGQRVRARFVVTGTLIGIGAGLVASLAQFAVAQRLAETAPMLTRIVAWMLAGSLIGFGLGMRWVSVNRSRPMHAFVGGLLGGGIGGLLFSGVGSRIPDLSQAMGFVLTGTGICFGITLAPILLRDGVLLFVSSGDPRAHNKFGRQKKEWELQNGDSYIIGSKNPDMDATSYRPEIDIFIPDAAIAARHATLFARDGRFYIARHPEISGESGLARYVLRVRGRTVSSTSEIRDADDILLGRTALKFNSKNAPAVGLAGAWK